MGKENNNSTFLVDFVAGGVAGSIAQTALAPVERVKLLLQVQAASTQINVPYTGILDCFSRVAKEQGIASFWRGNTANILRNFPTQALLFATKDTYRDIFVGSTTKEDFWRFFLGNLAAGGAAGATSLAVVYPLDLARTRLGADVGVGKARAYNGIFHCLSEVYKASGIRGIYRGFGISVGGIVVYRATFFGGYDTARDMILVDPKNAPFWHKWAIAQVVQTLSGFASYPFDTVRRRMMMQAGQNTSLYANSWNCWQSIYVNEGGVRAFFKGAGTNVIRGAGSSIILVLYDELKGLFQF